MTVSELAERVGIHPGSMPRYMKGQRKLTLDLVEQFASALGIPVGTLLARADERQKEG
jgi:transcriptional regulator with XRE-family HTH domain